MRSREEITTKDFPTKPSKGGQPASEAIENNMAMKAAGTKRASILFENSEVVPLSLVTTPLAIRCAEREIGAKTINRSAPARPPRE